MKQTQRILNAQTGDVAKAENYFSHTRAAELARDTSREFGDLWYSIRSLLFKDISRLKNPNAHLIRFSTAQKRQVYNHLQPADIILTYTAGYISDVCADDIVDYYKKTRPQQFELVLLADEDPGGEQHQARVLTGAEAEQRLKELMAATKP